MTTSAKIIVFGYHEVGYRCLEWLLAQGETVQAVFTHKDSSREHIWFRSVADLARAHQIPVFTPATAKADGVLAQVREFGPDVIYSLYYRNMLPSDILRLPKQGAFNMHGSLLPRYRGRVPINWAIINGERETGATLHHMVARADAGDIVDQEAVPIGPVDTARDVFLKVTDAAVAVLARNHEAITAGRARRIPQDEALATTFGARRPEDGRITWDATAPAIFNLARALTHPYPGAFSEVCGQVFFVWWGTPVELPSGIQPRPGLVVSVSPLIIATGAGGFRIDELEWADKDAHEHHNFVVGELVGL